MIRHFVREVCIEEDGCLIIVVGTGVHFSHIAGHEGDYQLTVPIEISERALFGRILSYEGGFMQTRAFASLRETIDVYGTTKGNVITFAIFTLKSYPGTSIRSHRMASLVVHLCFPEDQHGSDVFCFVQPANISGIGCFEPQVFLSLLHKSCAFAELATTTGSRKTFWCLAEPGNPGIGEYQYVPRTPQNSPLLRRPSS